MQTRTRVTGWFLMAVALGWGLPASANNIRVANVGAVQQDVDAKQVYVAFDLIWENSWRNEINWDAAWVFVKFRPEGSNDWEHAYLSTNSAAHLPAAGSVIAAVPDGMGAFVYRSGAYTGDVNYANTRLLWQYGTNGYAFARGAQVELSVHAIEMVYVKEGAFYVGSGGTETYSFTDGSWVSGATIPFLITNETAVPVGQTDGKLWATGSMGSEGELSADYPKGYRAFYCMKYKPTQGQYADFLNFLASADATARFPNSYGSNRHTIKNVSGVYTADAPDRVCNYLSWEDGARYLAWAGLRPISELEFEKAGRGFETPTPDEYAWGTSSGTAQSGEAGVAESGTETATPNGANHNVAWASGPVRAGIFATNGASRVTAGASYWGILDLSCYPCERAVHVSTSTGRDYDGSHGGGDLTLPADWPLADGTGSGMRVGAWSTGSAASGHLRLSNRLSAGSAWSRHWAATGVRGVRTAP